MATTNVGEQNSLVCEEHFSAQLAELVVQPVNIYLLTRPCTFRRNKSSQNFQRNPLPSRTSRTISLEHFPFGQIPTFSLRSDQFSTDMSQSTSGPVSTEVGNRIRVQFPVRDIYLGQPPRSTQPGHHFVGRRNEYQPKGGNALRLGSKGRYGSWVGGR